MRYTVTADVPDAGRADTYLHEGMVGVLMDLLQLRADGIGYTIEAFPADGPEPSHRGHIAERPEPEPIGWLQIETSQEVFDRLEEDD